MQGNGDGTADIMYLAPAITLARQRTTGLGIGIFTRAKAVVSAKFKKREMAVSKPMIRWQAQGVRTQRPVNSECPQSAL